MVGDRVGKNGVMGNGAGELQHGVIDVTGGIVG
jgi:hypothetical protein